jgi:ATP phosphoribosyltransferase
MLPAGSSNSIDRGRTNLAGFLRLGGACPVGYSPGEREYFPVLPDASDIHFQVGRPQNAPLLADRGNIDAFVGFGDLVCEAAEAGIKNIRKVLDLPFATVRVVVVARGRSPYDTLADLLGRSQCPVECAADLPFLARCALREEANYQARWGTTPPTIEMHGTRIARGCKDVRVTVSAGGTEPLVASGYCDCGVVVYSTGRTLAACGLKVISTIGTYSPALFCRAGIEGQPRLLALLNDYVQRLQRANSVWQNLQACRQLDLPYEGGANAHSF